MSAISIERWIAMTSIYEVIAQELARFGLALRGGFVPAADDAVPGVDHARPTSAVLMIGNAGRAMWPHFAAAREGRQNPMDAWTRSVIEPLATRFGARAVYPFEAPPLPFQRWAERAWPVFRSPMGLLIDAEYGPWHALRAALLFAVPVGVPEPPRRSSTCASCEAKPCLSTCPVGAFDGSGFDYRACRSFLASADGASCMTNGCGARAACPVGREHRYDEAQLQFHMRAFRG